MQYINTQQLSLFVPENKRVGDSFFFFVTGDVKRLMDYQFVGSRIMILVKKGTLSLVINGNSRVMREKSYADILDGTMIRFTEMSEDAEIFCAFTTKSFLLDAFQGVMPEPRDYTFKMLVDPVVNLEKSCRFEGMCCQMELLYSIISDTGHRYRTDLVKLYVKAFVLELSNALSETDKETLTFHKISKKELLMASFIDLVWKHLTETREVSFYARELCVTPKHLSRVVKETSGKTPHDIIAAETLSLAVQLLQNNSLLIQQIADILHFSDQAAFSKFFKKYVGMSPADYRKSYNESGPEMS